MREARNRAGGVLSCDALPKASRERQSTKGTGRWHCSRYPGPFLKLRLLAQRHQMASFRLLEENIEPETNKETGCPGMSLWTIFVMGVFRLDLNWDYDHLHGQVNNHKTLRQMLGHADIFDTHYYHLQTIKDNVRLLTPELLDKINQVVVEAGHAVVKKKENAGLRGRCDSFVVETNVHYPTDISLLYDAMRKVITLTARLCEAYDEKGWRQYVYNVKQVKRKMRAAQMKKRGGGKTDAQKAKRHASMLEAYQEYLEVAQQYLNKARLSVEALESTVLSEVAKSSTG